MPRKRKVPTPGAATDPRGGPRTGQPGRAYPNRSDLTAQPARSAPNQPYGARAMQESAQRAVPMAGGPTLPAVPGTSGVAAGPVGGPPPSPAGGPLPGAAGDFLRPSERPDEPLTAGLPVGPGAGPSALPAPHNPGSDILPQLQALYAAFPSEGLREIIEDIETGNGGIA